jgi:hypothetical protein
MGREGPVGVFKITAKAPRCYLIFAFRERHAPAMSPQSHTLEAFSRDRLERSEHRWDHQGRCGLMGGISDEVLGVRF